MHYVRRRLREGAAKAMSPSQELALLYDQMATAAKYPGPGMTADMVKVSPRYKAMHARTIEIEREQDEWLARHVKYCKGCYSCAR